MLALVSACGGISQSTETPVATTAEQHAAAREWDVFCTELSTTMAARASACLGAPELAPASKRLPVCDLIAASIAAGRILLQREAMPRCLDTAKSLPCEPWLNTITQPFVCPAVLVGTVTPSLRCFLDADCADPASNYCDGSDRCSATCRRRLTNGVACTTSTAPACVQGSTCDRRGTGTCIKIAREGERCGFRVGACDVGLTCGSQGICFPSRAGTNCSFDPAVCGPSMTCLVQQRFPMASCTPMRRPQESCDNDTELCLPGSYCAATDGATGVCKPYADLGARCGPVLQGATIVSQIGCLDGYCDRRPGALSGQCQPFKALGEPCEQNEECDLEAQRYCMDGLCVADTCGDSW